jgi:hypothetical protein
VLRQISLALSLVALETHTAITFKDNNCTYSCQYSPGTCFICGQMA